MRRMPELNIIGFDPGFLVKYKNGSGFDMPADFVIDLVKLLKEGGNLPKPIKVKPPKVFDHAEIFKPRFWEHPETGKKPHRAVTKQEVIDGKWLPNMKAIAKENANIWEVYRVENVDSSKG